MKNLYIIFIFILLFISVGVFGATTHVVKDGESIIDVAAMYDVTPLEIAAANNLNLNNPLVKGQHLIIVKMSESEIVNNIQMPTTHQVKKGDTLSSIAKKYGISVNTLAAINHLKVNSKLVQGKILKIMSPAHSVLSFMGNSFKHETGNTTLVGFALGLKGCPYVSGGSSRGGFDCSGFTTYVYKQFGKSIPRTSAGQYKGGKKVTDLQLGDIVCFTTYRGGCSHVGIYVGNNKFVHAATQKKGVVVSSLKDSYYSSRYLGARRY